MKSQKTHTMQNGNGNGNVNENGNGSDSTRETVNRIRLFSRRLLGRSEWLIVPWIGFGFGSWAGSPC